MTKERLIQKAQLEFSRFESSKITAARVITELEVRICQLKDELETARRLRNNISLYKADLDEPFDRARHTHGLQNL